MSAYAIIAFRAASIAIVCAMTLLPVSTGYAQDHRFEGIGSHHRPISTKSADAQKLFDQGLAFLYSFNHDEALRSFQSAAALDDSAVAIHWASALTNGPHINFPFVDQVHARAALQALERAKQHIEGATPVERALIDALQKRYADPPPEDRRPLDKAYADAMRIVWQANLQDADVGALFAESLMDLWPWDLWTKAGEPQPDTLEILKTLETVLGINPDHPLALHLSVHALEASPYPERAALAAERLRNLQPALGHMVHMPSHIDVRLGHWQRAIDANERAIQADTAYRVKSPEQDFFRFYMAHNHHMLAFAAMMTGREQRATRAIRQMLEEIPRTWLEQHAVMVDGMFAMPYEMHLRFGRWDEMLAEPEPPEMFPISRAFRLFARGVALAAQKKPQEARIEQRRFLAAKEAISAEAMFVMNPASKVLAVAESLLEGEILYREGKVEESLAALKESVQHEDELRYIEPPDWIQPVRHILGATLMDARRFVEAEQVYRDDLKIHPHNGWSLHGLWQSLLAQQRQAESDEAEVAFKQAWHAADVQLTSSCFCLPRELTPKP